MIAAVTLIVVLLISLIVVRVASEALTLTGLSRQAGRFQARSAWTGTGFTTSETESVVNHPVRRRIIELLMLFRGAGLVTAASTLMLSFVNVEQRVEGFERFLLLVAGVVGLYFLARSQWLDLTMSRLIAWALKRFTDLDTRDYANLLHLVGDFAITELKVRGGGWMADRRLADLDLPDEGVLVLGVIRATGEYIGAPSGGTDLRIDDTVLLYGRSPILSELDRRPADVRGEAAHRAAISERDRTS